MMQRCQCAHARVHTGKRVPDADTDSCRRAIGFAHNVAQPTHGFANATVASALRVRPGLPVAGNAHQDETRVERREHRPTAVPFLQGARSEVLYDYIRFMHQLFENTLPFGLAKVESDGLLVAPDHRPPDRGLTAFLRSPATHGIPFAGRLDLDDLSAHVAKQLAAEWTGDQRAELEHPKAGEGAGRRAGWCGHGGGVVPAVREGVKRGAS
jgi:hypothetical protein